MKLKLEVQPSKGVGIFGLGLPINDILISLTKLKEKVPKADFIYSKTNPLEKDFIVSLSDFGITMKFDPISQKLKSIEITNFAHLELTYQGTTFSKYASNSLPTFLQIYTTFGPTYPGEFDVKLNKYTLSYPGISFIFPIPQEHAHLYVNKTQVPIEFPDGTTPVCSHIFVYQGKSLNQLSVSPTFASEKMRGLKFFYEVVTVRPQKGIFFESRKMFLGFGMECQDVLSFLGSPSNVHFKRDQKMLIHASVATVTSSASSSADDAPDYFYNYFDFGIDILFDGETHRVKRFFLHTNLPGHLEFCNYRKCNFKILIHDDSKTNGNYRTVFPVESEIEARAVISCDMKWNAVQEILGNPQGDPVISNRGSTSNPFGATRFYGYAGLIFEVTDNNHLASLVVFFD